MTQFRDRYTGNVYTTDNPFVIAQMRKNPNLQELPKPEKKTPRKRAAKPKE